MLVTDAWLPQTNGVVNTLRNTVRCLREQGHEVEMVTPEGFITVPCPTYPEINLVVGAAGKVRERLEKFRPDALHIATEGPLGFAARRQAVRARLEFTTSYHTQFPQYLRKRLPVPLSWSYAALRWFHGAASHCMVSTPSVQAQLAERGFRNLVRWQRGVDTELFRPRRKDVLDLPRPIAAYVGRVAIEKNLEAFLAMPWKGSKLVIGDGPDCPRLRLKYPDAHYAGFRFGEDLASMLAAADVMVFPSLTDTFGLVNLEAMACGVPVAAFPVTGPIDVVEDGVTGALDTDLAAAAVRALRVDPAACRARALQSDWNSCARQFECNLVACRSGRVLPRPARARSTEAPVTPGR
jgi:glycosyltransferase involved in cell wall biosynthesis